MGTRREKGHQMTESEVEHLKRLACQIVAQLPDNPEEAVIVLQFAEGILAQLRGCAVPDSIGPSLHVVLALRPASEPSGR